MVDLGAFEIEPEDVERLTNGFTKFVNELLVSESAKAGLVGYDVATDDKGNVGDGGVDARIVSDRATTWLPIGDSCWQFKQSDISPAKCRKELRGAEWARDLIAAGASYHLVLGSRLTAQKIERRVSALRQEAAALHLGVHADRLHVLDANQLARWASEYPAIAGLDVFRSRPTGAVTLPSRLKSTRLSNPFVDVDSRRPFIDHIRAAMRAGGVSDLRVQGFSGLGKTRLILEALNVADLSSLVAYIDDSTEATSELFSHFMRADRTAIVVVDDCGPHRHEKLAERLSTDGALRLITAGEAEDYPIRSPLIAPPSMTGAEIEAVLYEGFPALWPRQCGLSSNTVEEILAGPLY